MSYIQPDQSGLKAFAVGSIYETALRAKYDNILSTIARDLGYREGLTGLTSKKREIVVDVADQAIFNWAVARRNGQSAPRPITNFEHLLDEYCALSDCL